MPKRIDPPHRNRPKAKPGSANLPTTRALADKSPVHAAIVAVKDFDLQQRLWRHLEEFEAMQINSQEDITRLFAGLMQLLIYGIVDVKAGDLMRKIISNTSESRRSFMTTEFPQDLIAKVQATIDRLIQAFEILLTNEVGQERAAKLIAKARSMIGEGGEFSQRP